MSRIDSSDWTGTREEQALPGRGHPTHHLGDASVTNYYQQIVQAQESAARIPAQVVKLYAHSLLVLFLAPLSLWMAWATSHAIIDDYAVQANSGWLLGGWLVSAALTACQFLIRSTRLILLRKLALAAVLLGTIAFSVWYAMTAVNAHENARAEAVERVFMFVEHRGRAPFQHVDYSFQRADGALLGEAQFRQVPDYSSVCASVQPLVADYGFRWVRLIERSRPPMSGLGWPVRKEQCFSNIPLSSLPK